MPEEGVGHRLTLLVPERALELPSGILTPHSLSFKADCLPKP
jgi:hypothetical protein